MHTGAQEKVLSMLRDRKVVTSREFIRECSTWDHRKIISRLTRKGHFIYNAMPIGVEAEYHYVDQFTPIKTEG